MSEHDVLEYRGLPYRRAGETGLLLPAFSLGLWQNYGRDHANRSSVDLIVGAFDRGITHFDNANRYGPPFGWAETLLGDVLRVELRAHRDELTISTKAGNPIGESPYQRGGTRKHLHDSLDASLRRLGVDHVDVFYHHSYDPLTPLEETAQALADIVRQGKAHYLGVSNYPAESLARIVELLRSAGTPLAIVQPSYSLLLREAEQPGGVLDVASAGGAGIAVYSPLAQGKLTTKYLDGAAPEGARATWSGFLDDSFIDEQYAARVRGLAEIAAEHGASLPQLALRWVLRRPEVTTVLLGASRVTQLDENLASLSLKELDDHHLERIDQVLASQHEAFVS